MGGTRRQQIHVKESKAVDGEKTAPATNETAATKTTPGPTLLNERDDDNAPTNTSTDNAYLQGAARPTAASQVPSAGDTISTPGGIKAAQEHLKYLGYDFAVATGYAPETGALTMEQLLFGRAAAQTAKTRWHKVSAPILLESQRLKSDTFRGNHSYRDCEPRSGEAEHAAAPAVDCFALKKWSTSALGPPHAVGREETSIVRSNAMLPSNGGGEDRKDE